MRQISFILLTLIITIISLPALGAWKLDNDNSRLTFTSVKKNTIAENHRFTQLKGSIDENARVSIVVDLSSVNTQIAIRDERMKNYLFETSKFSSAIFSAQLDKKQLKGLKKGQVKQFNVTGQLDFHGQQQDINIAVNVVKLNGGRMLVSTQQPFFIQAESFGLIAGINKLKELASLPSIDYVVPVSFSVVFTR